MTQDIKEMGYKVTHVMLTTGNIVHAIGSRQEVLERFAKVGVLSTGIEVLELGSEAVLLSNGMMVLQDHAYSGPTSLPLPSKDTGFVKKAENVKVEL